MINSKKLSNSLKENQAYLLLSEENRQYATGFHSSDGAVLITKDKCYLIVDFRYIIDAKRQAESGVEVVLMSASFCKEAKRLLEGTKINALIIEDEYVTLAMYDTIKSVFDSFEILPGSEKLMNFRMVKEEFEVEKIKKAGEITCKAFEYICGYIKEGMTEREIALELEFYMRKLGSVGVTFDTICVAGENSALCHGVPGEYKVKAGDFITMDFGAKIGGYCFDMTRTVAVRYATKEMEEIYNVVLSAQKNALENIKANQKGIEMDAFARNIIDNAGYKDNFGHGLGHGVGLFIHESPSLSPRYDKSVVAGSIVTVEPGIYIENKFGIRIEDTVKVVENGIENLTTAPKNLIIVG